MESLYTRPLESIPVENWLLELRMECYRRNLEAYPNLQTLVELKDIDFKKLGILNAKDRATMMGSLDQFRLTLKTQGYGSRTIAQQEMLKKGSSKKMKKLKGFLGGGIKGQHKNKKGQDIQITTPQLSFEEGLHSIPEIKSSRNEDISQTIPGSLQSRHYLSSSLEDLIQKGICTVENDYVPDPQASPQFRRIPLQRSYTVSEPQPTRLPTQLPVNYEDDLPDGTYGRMYTTTSNNDNNKHLSVISMESGLGMTCDVDERDDFNRSLPLEQQPWFYGMMRRNEVESLLDEDGDFLVTEDPISSGVYTLSMQWDSRCFHLPVNCNEVVMKGPGGTMITGYKYLFDNGAFDSIPELIYNHLRYRIPINSDLDGIIINPVNRMNNRMSFTSQENLSSHRPYGTLPRNFGRSIESNLQRKSVSPEYMTLGREKRPSLRGARSMSLSPVNNDNNNKSHHVSNSTLHRNSSSITNLVVRDVYDEDEMSDLTMGSIYQDIPSSPKPAIKEDIVRPRTISPYSMSSDRESKTVSLSSSCHEPDDYEFMGSVSIRNTLPPSPVLTRAPPRGRAPSIDSHYSTVIPRTLRSEQSYPNVQHNSAGVKYAEITFNRSSSTSAVMRGNSMRSRAQTVTYVSPRVIREEVNAMQQSNPHPFSTYSQLTKSTTSSSRNSQLSSSKPGSNRSSTESPFSSRPSSVIGKVCKAPQTVSEIPPFLKEFTNEELATHLTKADAVCFLLAPRPGEDNELWKNRVQELNTDSGVLIGLEVLAAKTGEKLWKKLFYRHLGISQLVTVSLIHTGETIERAKLLRRWIELANLLQSGNYGNLFSFMAIVKGLESPQVIDMTNTWDLLKTHYSDTYDIYESTLKGMILALSEGASIYAIEQLTIPAIQHLRKLYTDDTHSNVSEDMRIILEDFTTRTVGLDGLHSIISHTADLSINARKRLGTYSYNPLLFDFLMQDCARIHLQNMGTSSDDPLERYRRFNIVLDAMMSKLVNP